MSDSGHFEGDRFDSNVTGEDAFRDWEGAYLLGSLSAAERREFEHHLEECASCAAAVAELAGMPALLSKVSAEDAAALVTDADAHSLDHSAPPPTLLPRLVHSVRRRRRRRILVSTLGLAVAAAAIVLAVPLLLQVTVPSTGPTTSAVSQAQVALSQVVPSPLRASIRLVPQPWGTRVEMNCRYAGQSSGPGYGANVSADYAMYVTDAAGKATQIATWTAGPGQDAEPAGTTGLTPDQITSVDVRAVSTGVVLLRGSP